MVIFERVLTDVGTAIVAVGGLWALWRFLFKASFNDAMEKFSKPLDKLTDKIEKLTSRIDRLDSVAGAVDKLDSNFTRIDKAVAVHEQRLNDLEGK